MMISEEDKERRMRLCVAVCCYCMWLYWWRCRGSGMRLRVNVFFGSPMCGFWFAGGFGDVWSEEG